MFALSLGRYAGVLGCRRISFLSAAQGICEAVSAFDGSSDVGAVWNPLRCLADFLD